jgi:hypothetical protein
MQLDHMQIFPLLPKTCELSAVTVTISAMLRNHGAL